MTDILNAVDTTDRHLLFSGSEQPEWAPTLVDWPQFSPVTVSKRPLRLRDRAGDEMHFYYVADDFLSEQQCLSLIAQFDQTNATPVGVDGYVDSTDKHSIGSYRANAWAPDLACQLQRGFQKVLADERTIRSTEPEREIFQNVQQEKIAIPMRPKDVFMLGPTPYMRFMKYHTGGRHVPHYDALYTDSANRYVTLMSWVTYLNTPSGTGGEFQFVEDGQGGVPPSKRDRSDWRRMAEGTEVIAAVAPRRGRLLVFPHWLPHQVGPYEAKDKDETSKRIIIRGDLAYGWD